MNIVNRVFYKELLLSIAGVLLAFMMLFLTIDVLNEVRNVGQEDYRLSTLIKVVCLYQPEYVYQLLPICSLIGTVLALSMMAARSELVVWRVSGLSLSRLTRILVGVGIVFAAAIWLIGDLGISRASRAASEIKKVALHKQNFFTGGAAYWSKQNLINNETRIINIDSVKNSDTLVGVHLYDLTNEFTLKRIVEAQTAKPLGSTGHWQLFGVRAVDLTLDQQGLVSNRVETNVESLEVDLAENNLDVIRNYGQETINMTTGQLRERMQTLAATGQSTRSFEVAFWQKIFYPLSVVVMILLALPFAFMQTRKGGVGLRVFTGIMLGLSFFVLTTAAQYLGPLANWSPIGLAVTPSLLFLFIAIVWTRYVTKV